MGFCCWERCSCLPLPWGHLRSETQRNTTSSFYPLKHLCFSDVKELTQVYGKHVSNRSNCFLTSSSKPVIFLNSFTCVDNLGNPSPWGIFLWKLLRFSGSTKSFISRTLSSPSSTKLKMVTLPQSSVAPPGEAHRPVHCVVGMCRGMRKR